MGLRTQNPEHSKEFDPLTPNSRSNSSSSCNNCSPASASEASISAELKVYQAFIFSGPILFTFIILLLFYFFYIRRHSVDWSSLRMRTSNHAPESVDNASIRTSDSGLKKELREMLPIIIYKESFSVKDTQCSVCLADYQADDRLQQMPACGHTFHMDCIDHWLATHTTCPLCRLSLVGSANALPQARDMQSEATDSASIPMHNVSA
ncbi:RING-H2 finger protein atl7 [Ancistrocladus abbreviatus]